MRANFTQAEDFASAIVKNVLWQDDDEENPLCILSETKQAWHDENVAQFWADWRDRTFSLKTADQFGCVVWARILGVPAGLCWQEAVEARLPFGFGSLRNNFFNANLFATPFVSGVLTIDEMRRLLRMRYYAQTISPTVSNINYALADVFGDLGSAYVADSKEVAMETNYVFGFSLSTNLLAALVDHDILPRGSGVALTITNN